MNWIVLAISLLALSRIDVLFFCARLDLSKAPIAVRKLRRAVLVDHALLSMMCILFVFGAYWPFLRPYTYYFSAAAGLWGLGVTFYCHRKVRDVTAWFRWDYLARIREEVQTAAVEHVRSLAEEARRGD